jgi:hypothetical protein
MSHLLPALQALIEHPPPVQSSSHPPEQPRIVHVAL